MKKLNLCLIIENTTDIRLIDGLREYFNLSIFARKRRDYSIFPWMISKEVKIYLLQCNRLLFPFFLFFSLIKHSSSFDMFIVNSETLAGLALNLARFFIQKPSISIIQKPTLEYLLARYIKGNMGLIHYLFIYCAGRFLLMWNISRFDLNIVVSDFIRKKLSKYSKREIEVIPFYGIDKVFEPIKSEVKRGIKKKLSLPEDKYIIFISSRISPEKDIITLFKAAKSVIKKGINNIILLNLSGQYKNFVDMAKRFNLEKFVIGRPAISPYDLPPYYQAVDLCIQPSLFEGLGLSPLESLACGTPAIVSHTGGLKESTKHMVHALHFKPNDSLDLYEKILYAYNNRNEINLMAEKGKEWVMKNYNSNRVFTKFKLEVEKLKI